MDSAREPAPPTLPVQEQAVAQIWSELLGITGPDVHANFFDLGGHSLLLIELVSRLQQDLAVKTDVLELLEYPTIAGFTEHRNSSNSAGDRSQ